MIDENAFGVLFAHYDLESVEYSLGESAYLEYLARFNEMLESHLVEQPFGDELRRVELGHATYLEFADGEQQTDPIAWLRGMRQALVEADLPNICILTAGGRWVATAAEVAPNDPDPTPAPESGAWRVSTSPDPEDSNAQASPLPMAAPAGHERLGARQQPQVCGPSEALRKALAAEAFAQPTLVDDVDGGWGPGLYIEKEAIEQLGKSLKNVPTALAALTATFYRIGV